MHESRFTQWAQWKERDQLEGVKCPGIYALSVADGTFDPSALFTWVGQIAYIGMTNSVGGLKARLQQFDNAINGKVGHGGADRVRYKYKDYQQLTKGYLFQWCHFHATSGPTNLKIYWLWVM